MNTQKKYTLRFFPRLVLVVGIFDSESRATDVVENLIEQEFHADRISLLHKEGAGPGDDMLGLTYSSSGQRIKVWAKFGIILGGIWGLFTSMAGLYILSIMGELPLSSLFFDIVKTAGISAILGGLAMAGAAVLAEIASAAHETGVPKEDIDRIHQYVEQGHFIVILHCNRDQVERYTRHIKWAGADPVMTLPVWV